MGYKILVLGDSGTGKSASLRNFKQDEVLVINSAGKPLPFKNHFECVTPAFTKLTTDVIKAMDNTTKKVIIIDDAQYIMSFQYMRRIKENGWEKWNDIQGDFFNIIQHCDELPTDTIVYFLSHIQRDEEGHEKLKTMGKMLDEKITLEGLFTVVLKTTVQDGEYCFLTQNSGKDTVKSPIGMFDSYAIDNDLKYVDTKIRNYYEIGDFVSDEAIGTMDQEASKMVSKPERKRRARMADTAPTAPTTAEAPKNDDVISMTEEVAEAVTGTPVRRRRRKDTDDEDQKEVNQEAPAEEAKVEAVEEPKRRRRKKRTEPEFPDAEAALGFGGEDMPFEITEESED